MKTRPVIAPPFAPGPIQCGRDFPLSDSSSGMPNVADALEDLFRPIRIGVVTPSPNDGELDAAADGEVEEVVRYVDTEGSAQAGDGERLDITADGDRSWDSMTLYTRPNFNVATNTLVALKGARYRVTKKADWTPSGYVRYEMTQDYDANARN